MSNKAAWLSEAKAKPFKIDEAIKPSPLPHEVVIRNYAVAINPVDAGVQAMGILYEKYPTIIGCDMAGQVVEVGSEVSKFQKGDRVLGFSDGCETQRSENGAFQLYAAVNSKLVVKLPENVSYTEGCVLPATLCTAAVSLFQKDCLNLPHPQLNPKPTGKVLVLWGGSSSVGSCGIQLAKAAGMEVITTASAHNFEYCRGIGAEQVFDHSSPTIVDDIVGAVKGRQLAGVFSAITTPETIQKCAQIADRLEGNKFIATVLPSITMIPEGLPANIKTSHNWCLSLKNNEVGEAVLGNWLTPALANGSMKCKPDPHVVGQGLEKIQEACDLMSKGVSAKKLVVELP